MPGFENLWGSVDADETHGSVTLDTTHAAITLPGVFDDPRLTFDRLRGHGSWTIGPTAPGELHKSFAVTIPDFAVVNADAAASLSAQYSNPGHGRGSLDLKAGFERASVARIVRYLPTSIGEKLRVYLGHALQAGISRGATIEAHGDLAQFPYARAPTAGVFRIVAPFRASRFDPSPYPPRTLKNGTPNLWPALDRIDGVFELKQNVLRFDIDRAAYRRVALRQVTGRIDDMGTRASNLVITGNASGPLADMLDYVNHSALAGLSKHETEKVRADGRATLALKLTVPRTPKPHIAVEGTVGLRNNTLSMNRVPPLSQLTGNVHFTEYTVDAEHVAGRFPGGDVHASGGLKRDGRYALDLSGHLGVEAARGLDLHGPAARVLARMSGSAPYTVEVRGTKGQRPEVSADSDLTGLALDFPAPFNKPAGTPMPLHVSFRPPSTTSAAGGDAALERADLTFGPISATWLLRPAPPRAADRRARRHRRQPAGRPAVRRRHGGDRPRHVRRRRVARVLHPDTQRARQRSPPADAARVERRHRAAIPAEPL